MAILDVILLAPLLFGAYKGFSKGLITELASLLALILGSLIATKFMHVVEQWLAPYVGPADWLPLLAFIVLFIAVVIGVYTIGKVIKKIVSTILLGPLDKVGGAVFGITKWALFFGRFHMDCKCCWH